jgi:hypothetical protein
MLMRFYVGLIFLLFCLGCPESPVEEPPTTDGNTTGATDSSSDGNVDGASSVWMRVLLMAQWMAAQL